MPGFNEFGAKARFMIKFCSLFSGSSGNCIFLGTDRTKLLIDAGVSAKRIEQALRSIDEDPQDIDAILITHEHSDHTQGAGIYARRHRTAVYANESTWNAMVRAIGPHMDSQHQVCASTGGSDFQIGDIQVHSFVIPHDATDPVAYTFYIKDRKITVATDMGYITEEVRANVRGSDALLLESNHDTDMLMTGSYPWPLKKRIGGEQGHLCNEDAAAFVAELAQDGTKCIFLGHLSQENNRPALALETASQQLYAHGFSIVGGSDTVDPDIFRTSAPLVHLSVASRNTRSEVAIL